MMTREEAKARFETATKTLRDHGWTDRQLERAFDGLHREDAVERAERIAAATVKQETLIFAAIDRLEATDDEKATLRFADWGDHAEEIAEDADKAAKDRLAVLRAEETENASRVEGIDPINCDRIASWPGRLKVKRSQNGVFLTLEIGHAYISALEVDWWQAIRHLDDRFHVLVTGAQFAVDVLMAIAQKPPEAPEPEVEDGPTCGHSLCLSVNNTSGECIDEYDGPGAGDEWSGGFAENH